MNDAMLGHLKKWADHPELIPIRQFIRDMEARGEANGRRAALLNMLAARGLRVTAADRARIQASEELATPDRWIARAAAAPSVAGVLGPPRRRAQRRGRRGDHA